LARSSSVTRMFRFMVRLRMPYLVTPPRRRFHDAGRQKQA
jgi:hypothetical protein